MAAYSEQMKKDFEKAVGSYVDAFLELFELNKSDCWWVGDRIGLDLFCFGDMYAVSIEEMVYIVENGVTFDEYLAYIDYNEKCAEFNLPTLNLRSWHEGSPRVSDATIQHLKMLRRNLEKAIKDATDF